MPVGKRIQKHQEVSGVVLAYDTVPVAKRLADGLEFVFGAEKARGLRAEINFYGPEYPTKESQNDPGRAKRTSLRECGIGFHGDGERPDVIGVTLGTTTKELHFQGFQGPLPVGERVVVPVDNGDIYMMCEVACGHRWVTERRNKSIVHYRHAAGPVGGNKFTPPNERILATKGKRAAPHVQEQHREHHKKARRGEVRGRGA